MSALAELIKLARPSYYIEPDGTRSIVQGGIIYPELVGLAASELDSLLTLLEEVEWGSFEGEEMIYSCPSCHNPEKSRHKPDCRLAAAIKKLEAR